MVGKWPDELDKLDSGSIGGCLVDGRHYLLARVYYADTDFSGVVYHARYLEFLERARTEFLRAYNLEQGHLFSKDAGFNCSWVVKKMQLNYRYPAKMDDLLYVITCIEQCKGARGWMRQAIYNQQKTLLLEANVEVVLLNAAGRATRWPEEWIKLFVFCNSLH